jgi:hypothetical protein
MRRVEIPGIAHHGCDDSVRFRVTKHLCVVQRANKNLISCHSVRAGNHVEIAI